MSKSTSRRAVLAGIAIAPAVALTAAPVIAASSLPTTDDPIFAAIERHRRAVAEFGNAISALDHLR